MRQALRALGWATKVLLILIIIFCVTSVYSVFNLRMGFGEPQAMCSEGILLVSFPFFVNNSGYYDLSDLNLTTQVIDHNGTILSSSATFVPLVTRGSNIVTMHNVSINLDNTNLARLLFQDDNFEASMSIAMKFARTIPIEILMNETIPWGAPFYNFSIGGITYSFNGTHYLGVASISFENHSHFSNVAGTIQFEIYNDKGEYVGSCRKSLDVPSNSGYEDQIELVIDDPTKLTPSGQVYVFFETSMLSFGPVVIPYG